MKKQQDDFQKVNPYTQHLPYAELLDEEANEMLQDIITNLSAAILQREIRPGVVFWVSRLDHYMRIYDQRFTKEQHILLVKLLYSFITQPYLSYNVVEACSRILTDLLRKIKRLSRDDLVLDWRPLYDLVRRMCFCKTNRAGALHAPTMKTSNRIWLCVRKCRIYFSVESTQEMLNEMRPMLCPSDVVCDDALLMMSNFLPILLPPEHHDKGFKLWFEELMELWLNMAHFDSRCASLMHLFTNLAEVNIGYIDWTPYLPRLFNIFLRGFRLPPFQQRTTKDNTISSDMTARFIISMLGGQSEPAMKLFYKLMLTLKNFYHPSNTGHFQVRIQRFLCLAKYFCIRYHKERLTSPSWLPTIPEEHRLTDDDVDKFCLCLQPIVEVSMFSRYGSMETAKLLRDLVMLRPELFIPIVLDKSYAALTTLTEPHQILNVMPCLSVVARALLMAGKSVGTGNIARYPEGPSHLLRVVHCLLPGIDPNDFSKTVLTSTVISAFAALLPIVDCSALLHSDRQLTEEERTLCEASAQWEDFLLQLLDRCFCVFEQLSLDPEVSNTRPRVMDESSQESLMGAKLSTSILHLLQQCSPPLFEVVCKRMFTFATSHVLESKMAGGAFADMLENACQVNPELVWKIFFPHCCQTVLQLAADGDPKSEKADHDLIWNLQLMTSLGNGVDETALLYKEEIVSLLKATLHIRNKETYSMASDFLAGLLGSLTTLFCTEKRSTEEDFSASPEDRDYLKDWGAGMHIDDITVKWHVPNEDELDFVGSLLEEFLDPEIKILQDVAGDKCETEMDKEELHLRLYIINACLEGAAAILPDLGVGQKLVNEPRLQLDSVVPLKAQTFRITCPSQDKAAAKHATRRLDSANFFHNLLEHILKKREDDTTAQNMIVNCYCSLVTDEGCPREKMEARQMYNDNISTIFFDRVTGKKHRLRSVLIDRVELQHLKRMVSRYSMPLTVAHVAILDQLLKLSLSRYTVVRISAQQVLPALTSRLFGCIRYCLPGVLDCLKESETLTHEHLKGALFVMLMEPFLRYMSGRYNDMLMILPPLLQADHSDKPSIVSLVKLIIRELLVQGNYPSLNESMSDACVESACQLAEVAGVSGVQDMISAGRLNEQRTSEANVEAYNGLLTSLVQILCDEKVRLSHLQFCGGVLSALIRHDYPLPAPAIKVYLKGLVHDVLLYRRLSWGTMSIVLRQLRFPTDKIVYTAAELVNGCKQKDKSAMSEQIDNTSKTFPGGLRKDNHWILYNPDDLPTTKEAWNNFQFVHKPHLGYAGWPQKLPLLAPPGQQHSLAEHLSDLSESETMIRDAFSSDEFVGKLVGFFSQEVQKGRDIFDSGRFQLFKALFRNYLDSFVAIFRPHVERLAVDPLENNQRCAAEIIAGMLASCRHWSYEQIESLKEWLVPLLKTVFQKVSVDSSRDWYMCLTSCVGDRDPRSLYWLYELLFSCQLTALGGSFGDGSRLHLLERTVCETEWKAPVLLHRMNELLQRNISNPYNMIRRSVANVLGSSVLRYDCRSMAVQFPGQVPLCKDFLADVLPKMQVLLTSDDNDSPNHTPADGATSLSQQSASATSSASMATAAQSPQQAPIIDLQAVLATALKSGVDLSQLSSALGLPTQHVEAIKDKIESAGGSSVPTLSADEWSLVAGQLAGQLTAAAAAAPDSSTIVRNDGGDGGDGASKTTDGDTPMSPGSSSDSESDSQDEVDQAHVKPSFTSLTSQPSADPAADPATTEQDQAKEERAAATRTFKTVCSWISLGLSDPLSGIFAPLLPLICSQQGREHDPELAQIVTMAQRSIVFSLLQPGDFEKFLVSLQQSSVNLGWRGRKASLNFVKCVITTNLFTASMNASDMEKCLHLVLTLLEDEQQEVRMEASECLSGMIHVQLVPVSESLLERLRGLAATPLPKKRTLAQLAANYVPKGLVLRHAGTLGLCSLIRAFPYSVPSWMPEVLMILDRHMADPSPIQGTVREALSEFKRTHHDNWEADKLKFSDEQLQVLTELLISPSYYV
ncbi:proteasome activator complex subunit 4B-like [Sycon ciliatum]|uniref:proteasome activator complex subunit 4B-like n=1 Tax=Sycon ciliatum TaxID=27933 RepID=UPI0031F60ECF